MSNSCCCGGFTTTSGCDCQANTTLTYSAVTNYFTTNPTCTLTYGLPPYYNWNGTVYSGSSSGFPWYQGVGFPQISRSGQYSWYGDYAYRISGLFYPSGTYSYDFLYLNCVGSCTNTECYPSGGGAILCCNAWILSDWLGQDNVGSCCMPISGMAGYYAGTYNFFSGTFNTPECFTSGCVYPPTSGGCCATCSPFFLPIVISGTLAGNKYQVVVTD